MSIDVAAALRRRKPDRRTSRLSSRRAVDLKSVYESAFVGRPIFIPDTNVYILDAAGRLPFEAARLLDRGMPYHCSVCLAELTTGIANLDPTSSTWTDVRNHYVGLLASLPPTRILTPDETIWIDAGLISGTLARTQSFQPHQRKECLNDTLIYLTAARAGLPVLTQNRNDFDLIQQLAPEGQFIYF